MSYTINLGTFNFKLIPKFWNMTFYYHLTKNSGFEHSKYIAIKCNKAEQNCLFKAQLRLTTTTCYLPFCSFKLARVDSVFDLLISLRYILIQFNPVPTLQTDLAFNIIMSLLYRCVTS